MKSFSRFVKKNIPLVLGVIMLIMIVGMAIFAPYLAPYDPLKVNIPERLESMSRNHFLGTDPWGRDILSRIIFGSRYSLIVGVISIGISMVSGGILGVLGGYYSRSMFATLIVWITDITMAFPTLILAALIGMILGPGLFNTMIALAIAYFPRFIRLSRGTTLGVKEEVFMSAAKSLGMSDLRLLTIHLIPNMISPIIIMGVIWTSDAISLEVALSFLGLGVPPPAPSWGNILQDNLKYFQMEPLAVIWPCVAVAWAVQSLNLIGDRFRDILDPKMR
jgi:peptide/nickel transport system permease protein